MQQLIVLIIQTSHILSYTQKEDLFAIFQPAMGNLPFIVVRDHTMNLDISSSKNQHRSNPYLFPKVHHWDGEDVIPDKAWHITFLKVFIMKGVDPT